MSDKRSETARVKTKALHDSFTRMAKVSPMSLFPKLQSHSKASGYRVKQRYLKQFCGGGGHDLL